jgi:undecaprenyl-diphosphatase
MQMDLGQALFIGALQGVAELFPISSLAQTILVPALLKWDFDPKEAQYLSFTVALHLATAVALVLYFWKDWARVIKGFAGCVSHRKLVYDKESKFAWLLVAGTIIVGLAGLALDKKITTLFEDRSKWWIVGVVLVINGFVMFFADLMKRKSSAHNPDASIDHPNDLAMHAALVGRPVSSAPTGSGAAKYTRMAEDLSFPQATVVGAVQSFALLPGISRSGVTIVAGLFAGLTYEEASRFSFMLATPIITLAAIKKVPLLLHGSSDTLMLAALGSGVAFVSAFLSVSFLMKYFHTHRLWPFGIFCIVFGLFSAVQLKHEPQKQLGNEVGVNPSTQVVTENAPTSR